MSTTVTVTEGIFAAAPKVLAYEAVTDLTKMGRWSPENTGATPVSALDQDLFVGCAYWGHNKRRILRWTSYVVVTAAEPGERFTFEVRGLRMGERTKPRFPFPIATWEYRFQDVEGGTQIEETWTDNRGSSLAGRISRTTATWLIGGQDFGDFTRQNIRKSLRRLKDDLEAADSER